jgi:hypothetical protein
MLWAGANNYFSRNWQASEMLGKLKRSGVKISVAQELALWCYKAVDDAD